MCQTSCHNQVYCNELKGYRGVPPTTRRRSPPNMADPIHEAVEHGLGSGGTLAGARRPNESTLMPPRLAHRCIALNTVHTTSTGRPMVLAMAGQHSATSDSRAEHA